MANTKNPQAYPTLFYNQTTGEPNGHDAGMTLRDYFAAKAISGVMSGEYFGSQPLSEYVKTAFDIADAMLEARENETI